MPDFQSIVTLMLVCNNEEALAAGTDLAKALPGLERKLRKDSHYTDEQIAAWKMRCNFFADEFAKKRINNERDYYFSAILTSYILEKNDFCDGILYPSVAYAYRGHNIVYRPRLIEQKGLVLDEALFLRIEVPKRNRVEYEILHTTKSFDGDVIVWS